MKDNFFNLIEDFFKRYMSGRYSFRNEQLLFIKFAYLKKDFFDFVKKRIPLQTKNHKNAIKYKRLRHSSGWIFVIFALILILIKATANSSKSEILQFINQNGSLILLIGIIANVLYEVLICRRIYYRKWKNERITFEHTRSLIFKEFFNGSSEILTFDKKRNEIKYYLKSLKGFLISILMYKYSLKKLFKELRTSIEIISKDKTNLSYEVRSYFAIRYFKASKDLYTVTKIQRIVFTFLAGLFIYLLYEQIYNGSEIIKLAFFSVLYIIVLLNVFVNNYFNSFYHNFRYFKESINQLDHFIKELAEKPDKNEFAKQFISTKAENLFMIEIVDYFRVV